MKPPNMKRKEVGYYWKLLHHFFKFRMLFSTKKSIQRLLSTWQKWNINDTLQHSWRHTQHLYLPLFKQICFKATFTWILFGMVISSARALKPLSGSSVKQDRLARVETVKGTEYWQISIVVLSQSNGIRSFVGTLSTM